MVAEWVEWTVAAKAGCLVVAKADLTVEVTAGLKAAKTAAGWVATWAACLAAEKAGLLVDWWVEQKVCG